MLTITRYTNHHSILKEANVSKNTIKNADPSWFNQGTLKEFSDKSQYFSDEKEVYREKLVKDWLKYNIPSNSNGFKPNPIIPNIIKCREDSILDINKFFNYAIYIYIKMDKTDKKIEIYNLISNSMGYIEYMNKVLEKIKTDLQSHISARDDISNLLMEKIKGDFSCQSKGIEQLIDEDHLTCPLTREEINDKYEKAICILAHFIFNKDNIIKPYRTACDLESLIENYKTNPSNSLHPSIKDTNFYFDICLKEKFAEKSLDSLIESLKVTMDSLKVTIDSINDYIDVIEKVSTLDYELEKYLEAKNLGHLSKKIDQQYLKSTFKIKNLNMGLSLTRELARRNKYVIYPGFLVILFIALAAVVSTSGMIKGFKVDCRVTLGIICALFILLAGDYINSTWIIENYTKSDPRNPKLWDAFAEIF